MTASPHNVPAADKPVPDYAERRAIRKTKREERANKRAYEEMKGRLRSQLRKQVDQIAKENGRNLIFALLNGASMQVNVQIKPREEETPPITAIPEEASESFSDDISSEPLIKIVPR